MLRLHDSRTGRAETVVPARRGELRTYLAGPVPGRPGTAAGVRSLLLADLIRRVAEGHGLLVLAWQGVSAGADGQGPLAACGALNIYPADYAAHPPDGIDIHIDGAAAGEAAGHWVRAAPTLPEESAAGPEARGADLAGLAERGLDPLALRLVLLREHYRQPVAPGWRELATADADLRRWRELVAGWATRPSRPMRSRYLTAITGAFDDDLDIPAGLRTLDTLAADGEVPPGSRFEMFAHLDRVLALDLARDVGR